MRGNRGLEMTLLQTSHVASRQRLRTIVPDVGKCIVICQQPDLRCNTSSGAVAPAATTGIECSRSIKGLLGKEPDDLDKPATAWPCRFIVFAADRCSSSSIPVLDSSATRLGSFNQNRYSKVCGATDY